MIPVRRRVARGVFVAACLPLLGVGCSFIFSMDADQCETNDDCAVLADSDPAFLGSVCTEARVCVQPSSSGAAGSGGGTNGCESAVQCTSDNNGVPSICPEPGGACVVLLNEDCTDVVGDYTHPDVALIGLLNSAPFGPAPDQFYHNALLCLAQHVIDEIETNVGGIPHPSGAGLRPVAFVSCNERPDVNSVADFLFNEVGIRTFVGTTFAASAALENDVMIPNGAFHIIPSAGLPAFKDLIDPDNLIWTIVPNYAKSSIGLGRMVEAGDAWLREEDPMLGRIRVALYANQDSDVQMAQYALDTDRIIFNGEPANLQDPPDADCPDGCFRYWNASQYKDSEGNVQYGEIISTMTAFNPHILVALDADSGFSIHALGQLEEADTVKPDPLVMTRFPEPLTPDFLKGLLLVPPKPGVETRVHAIDYLYTRPQLFTQFANNYGGTCPTLVPPLAPFFPPFIEFHYDAFHAAVLAQLANGNYQKHSRDLTGAEIAAGLMALAPIGQQDPSTAQPFEIKATNLGAIYNALVTGKEVDIAGATGELDFDPEWKSPVMDLDIECIQPGANYPDTAAWGPSGVTWDGESDVLVPGPERQNFNCMPLQL